MPLDPLAFFGDWPIKSMANVASEKCKVKPLRDEVAWYSSSNYATISWAILTGPPSTLMAYQSAHQCVYLYAI